MLPGNSPRWRRSSARTVSRVRASSAESGSSSSRTAGSTTSARASAARCAWPPESSAGRASPQPVETDPVQPPRRPSSGPPPSRPRACAARTRRCPRPRGAGRAARPGTPCRRSARAPAGGSSRRPRVVPSTADPAGVGRQQTGEDPHQRGLARAVGAEQREHLAVGDLEGGLDGQRAALDPDVDVEAHSAAPRAAEPAVAQEQQRGERDHQQHQRQDDRCLRVALQRQVDRERHRLRRPREVAGERDRRAELAQRPRPAEHRARGDAGRDERQGDAAERRPSAGAERRGDVLEAGVGGAQRALDADHQERHRDERLGDHDGRRRERDRDAERLVEPGADDPPPSEDEEQRDATDHRRQHERHGHQRPQHGPAADRRARQHPGQRDAEDQRDQRRDRRRDQRQPQRLADAGRRELRPQRRPRRPDQQADDGQHEEDDTDGRGDQQGSGDPRPVAATAHECARGSGRTEPRVLERLLALVREDEIDERLRGVRVRRVGEDADRVLVDRRPRPPGTRCPRRRRRPMRRRTRRRGRRRPRRARPW